MFFAGYDAFRSTSPRRTLISRLWNRDLCSRSGFLAPRSVIEIFEIHGIQSSGAEQLAEQDWEKHTEAQGKKPQCGCRRPHGANSTQLPRCASRIQEQ